MKHMYRALFTAIVIGCTFLTYPYEGPCYGYDTDNRYINKYGNNNSFTPAELLDIKSGGQYSFETRSAGWEAQKQKVQKAAEEAERLRKQQWEEQKQKDRENALLQQKIEQARAREQKVIEAIQEARKEKEEEQENLHKQQQQKLIADERAQTTWSNKNATPAFLYNLRKYGSRTREQKRISIMHLF